MAGSAVATSSTSAGPIHNFRRMAVPPSPPPALSPQARGKRPRPPSGRQRCRRSMEGRGYSVPAGRVKPGSRRVRTLAFAGGSGYAPRPRFAGVTPGEER
jgi:hypothetical protein